MTRIISFRRPIPMDDECVWITSNENFDIEEYLGNDVEILSDEKYNIDVDATLPLDTVLIVE